VTFGDRLGIGIVFAVLAGCGGGGGGSPESPAPTPRGWGQRDPSYGVDGVAAGLSMAGHSPMGRFAFTRDGSTYALPNDYVVKLDPRGRVVTTFGIGGQASIPARYTGTSSPIVDIPGNVYVPMGFGAVKIRPDGTAATDFGAQGVASAQFPNGSPWMNALALDAGGVLYAAGDVYVAKFDSQGRVATAYAEGGMHTLYLGPQGNVFDVQVDGRGNTYLAGDAAAYGAVVVKLDPAGNLATDFGAGGMWIGGCGGSARATAPLPNGEVVVVANCYPGTTSEPAATHVFKIDERGNTVAAYREGGRRPMLFGTRESYVEDVLALPSGEVVIAGFRPRPGEQASGCGYTAAVAKLDTLGEPVASASGAPFVLLESEYATDLGIDAAGWIYVGTMRRNSCANHPPMGSTAAIYKLSAG